VDVLIIGDVDLDLLDARLEKSEKIIGREINYVLYSRKEFREKKGKEGFLTDVLSGKKIMLRGLRMDLKAL